MCALVYNREQCSDVDRANVFASLERENDEFVTVTRLFWPDDPRRLRGRGLVPRMSVTRRFTPKRRYKKLQTFRH